MTKDTKRMIFDIVFTIVNLLILIANIIISY